MKIRRIFFILIFAAMLCSGCLMRKTETQVITELPSKNKHAHIEVIELKNVPKPYRVIGTIEVKAGMLDDEDAVIASLKKRARRMGGDAIIIESRVFIDAEKKKDILAQGIFPRPADTWVVKVIAWQK